MLWVGVRYRGIALPDIMKLMKAWLDGRGYRPDVFEYVISGSGTLVRAQFKHDVEAAEFAKEFAGSVSDDCPSIERAGVSQSMPREGTQQEGGNGVLGRDQHIESERGSRRKHEEDAGMA